MQTISVNIFKYNELSEKAKEKARQWWRDCNYSDDFWSECVIDDAKEIGKRLGFDINKVYYSGFCSQGDGACFEGVFRTSDFKKQLQNGGIRAYAPQDKELHRISNEIEKIANEFFSVYLKVRHSGRYYHENCTEFKVSIIDNEDNEINTEEAAEAEKYLIELSRDLMLWIYCALEKEYEYQNADEQIAENIVANNYDFTEEGEIWH